MIAYLLLRISAQLNCIKIPALRFAELVGQCLFMRRPIAEIDKPPPVNPNKRQSTISPDQLRSAMGLMLFLTVLVEIGAALGIYFAIGHTVLLVGN